MALDWQKLDSDRTILAVQEIAKSPNLRFFFRSILSACGANTTPEGGNALATARECGRHSVGQDLIATFFAEAPEFYPALMLEEIKEQQERTRDV